MSSISLRFPTDHGPFGAESNAEREEREAVSGGMWDAAPDVSFFDAAAEADEHEYEIARERYERRLLGDRLA